ncbi:PKD domain-containing protein [Flavimarina sp. Hel_I_48]|uniref:PKD domain-containing protein n=1 Tax=Flavimarina sp. Hel_I_48 TaxID=1392488 RepID=UPI000AB79FC8|nr:PKD domain-containing protein [Flavimarina sp. Hel_I_48]
MGTVYSHEKGVIPSNDALNLHLQETASLNFSKSSLSFSGQQGNAIANQSVTLTASEGNPSIVLSDDPDSSGWLILPTNPSLGVLSFGIKENLAPGTYSTTVFAIDQPDQGYTNAEISINVTISASQTGPTIATNVDELIFEIVTNNQANNTDTKQLSITNTGNENLIIDALNISGNFSAQWSAVPNASNQTISPGASRNFDVTYAPERNNSNLGYQDALLTIVSNSVNNTNNTIGLYALKKTGLEGDSEPALQDVVNTLGIGIDVGWETLADGTETVLKGDEVFVQKWKKIENKLINITPVGRYSPEEFLPFGWYTTGGGEPQINEIGVLANGLLNAQRLYPPISSGNTIFDPGTADFGIYVFSNSFDRYNYSEDGLNGDGTIRRVRTYPVKDRQGVIVENSYLITFEDASNGDYQDYMFLIDNVTPVSLRPIITFNTTEFIGDAITAGDNTSIQAISITNTGNSILYNIGASVGGASAQQFSFNGLPSQLNPGATANFNVVFNPSSNGPQFADLKVTGTNAVAVSLPLRGLGKAGNGGTNEPSLQWILDTQLGTGVINVGDTNATTNIIDLPAGSTYNELFGDEIEGQLFQKSGDQAVDVEVLGTFGPEQNNPVVRFGWYTEGNATQENEIAQVSNANGNGQRLNPMVNGTLQFDPSSRSFGFYSSWPFFNNRTLYSEDALNIFTDAIPHHVRTYKLPNEQNAYIIVTEEHISGFDYQDLVLLVRNIKPAPAQLDGLKINFSDAGTPAPSGYLRDSGNAFGDRGNGSRYGWLNANDNTPADVSRNTRNRKISGVSTLQNTFTHMQYGSFSNDSSLGYLPDAKWEIELPNGTYEVTVSVGDPEVSPRTNEVPQHTINAESATIINKFVPSGPTGAASNFSTVTRIVVVQDGRLSLSPSGGFNTKINFVEIEPTTQDLPYFTGVTPNDNATDVPIREFQITVDIFVPNGYELDKTTTGGNVQLFEISNSGEEVLLPTNANDTGGGDAITLTPRNQLKEFTSYVFRINDVEANRVNDLNDRLDFVPFESSFTTGALEDIPTPTRDLSGIKFTKVQGGEGLGEGTRDQLFSSLVIGPDGKLYASTLGNFQSDGTIQRWDIKGDGTLTNLEILRPNLKGAPHPETGANNNNDRIIIGLVFDPASTADNLIAYITHSTASVTNGPEWDGVVSRLSGPNLTNVQDIIVHLPRSIKDHLTNSIIFDNEGMMYISQGSNTAGGAPDPAWGQRKERLLSGAVLKLDFNKLPAALPLDVYTTDNIDVINSAPSNRIAMSDGSYNPYATNSPLTIFATGIRNTYDLLWHSNGWLYMPTNGTAGNNINSPVTPSTSSYKLARRIDGRTTVKNAPQIKGGETQKDWLFKTRGGSYHGHPNPYRGEFILNHGGLSYSGLPGQSESSHIDVQKYPRALGPDVNYLEPAYDFGFNKSPNGVIEYKGDAFGGRLKGLIMVVRFSGQNDLLVMNPETNGDISEVYMDIPGLSGFDDPLDVIEDPQTGNLYVSEYDRDQDGVSRLTLLRADDPDSQRPEITTSVRELLFETTINNQGVKTQTKEIIISNTGLSDLVISDIALQGDFASQFNDLDFNGTQTIAPGQNITLSVTYAPDQNTNDLGYQNAEIVISNNSEENPTYTIGLYGLKKEGLEGDFEPSLQDIVNTLGIGIDVGWSGLTTTTEPTLQGDEIQFSQWIQATDAPITMTPVGRYSPSEKLPFGWYTTTDGLERNQIGVLEDGLTNAQRLYPPLASGDTIFNPQGSLFGLYVFSQSFDRYNYTQDSLNTDGVLHRARSYPLKDRQGNLIDNKYLITFEDATNGDYQDYIFILSNAIPFNQGDLALSFDKKNISYLSLPGSGNPPVKDVTLSANGFLNSNSIDLTSSQPWVIIPDEISLDNPFEIGVNTQGMTPGQYTATVVAKLEDYKQATLNIVVNITNDLNYTYEFNFQDIDEKEQSPASYSDDFGLPYNGRASSYGDLTFGWVLPNTRTPASSVVNGRNRNTGINDDVLLKTFSQIGHRDQNLYPTNDWIVNLPNGSYAVNISVGDPDFSDSNHVLDVNGETVIAFDQQNDNPEGLTYFENTAEVTVRDGILRLSLGEGGVNAKVNYIRIAPMAAPQTPPQVTASFDGVENELNNYRGSVNISLDAKTVNNDGTISSLQYSLDGANYQAYNAPLTVNTTGDHILLVRAEDSKGVSVINNYYFTVSPASNAILYVENMTKIPGTNQGFPADDYYTFYRLGDPGRAITHENNILRINNTGTANLIVSNITISNTRNYSFSYVSSNTDVTLPLSIAPGQFVDLNIKLIGSTTNGQNKIFKETIAIETNADNSSKFISTLHGGFAPQPENGPNFISDEINAQEVFDAFGYRTSMRSIVNDRGTITPVNPNPTRPSSNAPLAENINAGYEGDLIYAESFVQVDKSTPIRILQLSAFHGYTPASLKFISVNGTGIVGGVNAVHTSPYYQTLLPKNSKGEINNAVVNSISTPFRIAVENYLNTGGNDLRGTDPAVLGLRVYKVINRDGEIVPNQYIVLQDYVQNGCGAGSANCDWNDNTFLITNVRPQEQPSVSKIAPYYAYQGEAFSYSLADSFLRGYAGNQFRFRAVPSGGSEQPLWLNFDPLTGTFSGTPPENALDSYTFTITATDTNGIELTEEFTLFTIERGALNDFSLRINAGGPTLNYQEREFVSDRFFTAGEGYTNGRAQVPTLYQSERSEDLTFGYSIPVPDDYTYKVTLHFAEIYWGATGGGAGGVGKRVFDVKVQDSLVLDNYDITADVGAQTPVVKTFEATVSNGKINIELSSLASTGGTDFPMLSALEIEPIARINSSPQAIISATPVSGAAPLEVDFIGNASTDDIGIEKYEWVIDDEIVSTLADFQYLFEETGVYTVTLTVTDAEALSNSASIDIRVNVDGENAAPIAIASVSPASGNAPLDVIFTGSASTDDFSIENYVWRIGDSLVSTEPDFPYTFTEAGNYTASLTVTDAEGLSDMVVLEIKVSSATGNNPPDAIAIADKTLGVAPLSVNFTGSTSIDDVRIESYVWKVDDSIVSTAPDFNYNFLEVGNYKVVLTVLDEEGLSDTAALTITASSPDGNTAPNAIATANITQGPAPLSVTFTGSNSTDDQGIVSYEWQIDGNTVSTDPNFTNLFELPGNYRVTLIVADAQGLTNRATLNIVVTTANGNEPPKAVITSSEIGGNAPFYVEFSGSSSTDDDAIVSYEWRINGNVVSESIDFDYTFPEQGIYEVSLTVTDSEGLTDTETIRIDTKQDGPFSIMIYPNPATTQITIRMENAPAKAKAAMIVDARGRIIHTYDLPQDQEETIYQIPLPILAAGMYIIVIDDMDGNEYIERLIVKNY